MKIIIPMAGIGKRLRPHTFTTPKPLIPIAGKPIVLWLIEELINICDKTIDEIAFIIGNFSKDIENQLIKIAESFNTKAKIYYQKEALGTAHAVYCAGNSLDDEVIIAFADTIFFADFSLDTDADSIIWVKEVEDPTSFGVVKINNRNLITDFVEKPKEFISNKAIIGIYYFKNGSDLKSDIKYLIDNNIRGNNEFQITDALENLKKNGYKFSTGIVQEWLDCGNKNSIIETQKILLDKFFTEQEYDDYKNIKKSKINLPCYIHEDAIISNSVIGPYVSVGAKTKILNSVVSHSIIQNECIINFAALYNSMISNYATVQFNVKELDLGDYNSCIE